ncbi:MAG: LptF/LptG family permease [Muribaculaceae bacterium]|nr:LptF/LptG family permease [Muribaculaceae bacterium]
MFGIKRLYTFMLQRFLPLLAMTFFICLFIVLMQFLWRSIDDLVGKGLEIRVIAELFFYAALTMVPMALPLAVLLASLMVFGNLGEKFELTAMKAAGISLFKIMRPLIILMSVIAVGAFFFQNNVLPIAQTKMWTLLFSVRQKSPEVEIPVRSFYDQIPNMNLYVERKNPETGMLYGMIIYDLSRGIDNSRVIMADSGRFNFTEDRTRLFLRLHSGEMFENMRDNSLGVSSARYLPFRREQFKDKDIYFPFDMNFNRMDEAGMRSQYIGQNVKELLHSIDSIQTRIDSVGDMYARELRKTEVLGLPVVLPEASSPSRHAGLSAEELDSIYAGPTPSMGKSYLYQAIAKMKRTKQEYEYRSLAFEEQEKLMRRHDIEMQKKFTLSFACLIFFFIGAPLGAIIKKGGLGTPLVISVLLFIVYYIIDNTGYKMARDGKVAVWVGIWLSSAVLLPLGVFFTYKAVGDSAVFNADAYRAFFRRLTGKSTPRALTLKEVRMEETESEEARRRLEAFRRTIAEAQSALAATPRLLKPLRRGRIMEPVVSELEPLVGYLSNTDSKFVIGLLNEYPFAPRASKLGEMEKTTERLQKIYEQPEDKTEDTTSEI